MTPLLSTPLLRAQSDRRLTALARDGHDRAFEQIVERYRRPLERYLRRLLSEPLAEDVLQATFVRAWQSLRAGSEVRELRPWLYRIAHNQALNALRAAGAALPDVPGLPPRSTEIEVERREELRATLDGIEALPDRQRAALLAVAVADRPHADVAAELGLTDGALRQLLLRARTALRTAATALTPYPFVTWAASGQEVTAARVAEVAAGAGGAGIAIKTGAAVLAAGALVASAPALRDEHAAPTTERRPATAASDRTTPARAAAVRGASVTPTTSTTTEAAEHRRGRSGGSGHGSSRSGHGGGSSSRGPGPGRSSSSGQSSHSGSGSDEGDRSQSGSGGDDATRSGGGDDATPSGRGEDRSGSGGGDDRSGSSSDGERSGSDGERSGDD